MECRESQSLLHGYIDGELEPRATLDLEGHLENCQACARERQSHEAVSFAFKAAGAW